MLGDNPRGSVRRASGLVQTPKCPQNSILLDGGACRRPYRRRPVCVLERFPSRCIPIDQTVMASEVEPPFVSAAENKGWLHSASLRSP